MSGSKVDDHGNANGGTPTVPATNIASGGLSANEIAEREAALAVAERERAAMVQAEAEARALYPKGDHA